MNSDGEMNNDNDDNSKIYTLINSSLVTCTFNVHVKLAERQIFLGEQTFSMLKFDQ